MKATTILVLSLILLVGCGGMAPVPEIPRAPRSWPVPTIAEAASFGPAPALLPSPSSSPAPEPPPPLPIAPTPAKPHSGLLKSGLYNPMPGGILAGYQADTGLDIAGNRLPVYAIAAGTLDYSERGHTLWTGPRDTPNSIRFELDTPIPWGDRQVTHVYYSHLSKLETVQHEGETPRRHVEGGELLGVSGVARGSPHLHMGLLLDGETSQCCWGTFLLADQIRKVLGGYRNGDRL